MIINETKNASQTIITLNGMLDSTSAPQFQEIVDRLLKNETIDVVIDMTDLTYTSSQGLRIILTLIKAVIARNGKLIFRNIRPAVREVFDMAGISQAMNIE